MKPNTRNFKLSTAQQWTALALAARNPIGDQ